MRLVAGSIVLLAAAIQWTAVALSRGNEGVILMLGPPAVICAFGAVFMIDRGWREKDRDQP